MLSIELMLMHTPLKVLDWHDVVQYVAIALLKGPRMQAFFCVAVRNAMPECPRIHKELPFFDRMLIEKEKKCIELIYNRLLLPHDY